MPQEPPPTPWDFPDPATATGDLVAVGADLEPGSLLAAYRSGLFPMPVGGDGAALDALGWWSPDPRGVLPLAHLRVSRSLRRSRRRFEVRVDTAFADVIAGCASADRDGAWITPAMRRAYLGLYELGWAHSVETWSLGNEPELAGGLYGVAIGGLFAGESMFHRAADASKVALVGLVELLSSNGGCLLDVQWMTPHLASLGVVEVSRRNYLQLLTEALQAPLPAPFVS